MKVIVSKKGAINSSKYKELKEAGYIVLSVEDPADVKVLEDSYTDGLGKVIFESALQALSHGNDDTARKAFGEQVRKNIQNYWFREEQKQKK